MRCCTFRKGDLHKCIPLYIIGAVFIIVGLPLMLVGIIARFQSSDLVGYIGGICIIFGLMFMLLWHMLTIQNLDKKLTNLHERKYDRNMKHSLKMPSLDSLAGGNTNGAFERDLPGYNLSPSSEVFEMNEKAPQTLTEFDIYGKSNNKTQEINSKDKRGYDNPALVVTPDGGGKEISVIEDQQNNADRVSEASIEVAIQSTLPQIESSQGKRTPTPVEVV